LIQDKVLMPISESACGLRNSMHHPVNAGLYRYSAKRALKLRSIDCTKERVMGLPMLPRRFPVGAKYVVEDTVARKGICV
jgi:hypothetical protein